MSKPTLGELANKLFEIRARKKVAEAVVENIGKEYAEAEKALMEAADEQQTTTGKGSLASFSIGERVVPQVKDWAAFYKFIKKHDYYHLLERRPSVTGCRELFDTKGAIPGVEKFTMRKVNLKGE